MFWKVLKDGRAMFRPVTAQDENAARRRILASLGMELEPIGADEFAALEARSLASGGLPAISEACEPGEAFEPGAPCDGSPGDGCPLTTRCPNWLHRARGLEATR